MRSKLLEIRDRGTCVPALAVEVSAGDGPIVRRAGFGGTCLADGGAVILVMLAKPKAEWDPWAWDNARTMRTAHLWIVDNWYTIEDGQVVDVRTILGETAEPAPAECV